MSELSLSPVGRSRDPAPSNDSSYTPDVIQASKGLLLLKHAGHPEMWPDVEAELEALSSALSSSFTRHTISGRPLDGERHPVSDPATSSSPAAFTPINKPMISRGLRRFEQTSSQTGTETKMSISTNSESGSVKTNGLSRTPLPTLPEGPPTGLVYSSKPNTSITAKLSSSSSPTASLSSSSGSRFGVLPAVYSYAIITEGDLIRQAAANCWESELIPNANFGDNDQDDEIWRHLLFKLGIKPEEFPSINVSGMEKQPGTAGKPGGQAPSWNYLMYTLIAVSPCGRLKQNMIYNLCLAWCSRLKANNSTCRHGLCTSRHFYREDDPNDSINGGGWHRLARLGEIKIANEKKRDIEKVGRGEDEDKDKGSPSGGSSIAGPGPQTEASRKRSRATSSRSPKKGESKSSGAKDQQADTVHIPDCVEDGKQPAKRIRKTTPKASQGTEMGENNGTRLKAQSHRQILRFRTSQPNPNNNTSVGADLNDGGGSKFSNPASPTQSATTPSASAIPTAVSTDRTDSKIHSDEALEQELDSLT